MGTGFYERAIVCILSLAAIVDFEMYGEADESA
eukprot:CAMPEP_0176143436 /NCGR_PEP_ID=MMETSP0120_2-20121206/73008_1 /TAXON_ID=160619 /ORGANISM="Kryptoperidinium foliaceum, Strain CCMP 1326" /LENGTH=32 /DNA_ID= /DNA_START= /DNA_END= /DNA_ORIENTATION=